MLKDIGAIMNKVKFPGKLIYIGNVTLHIRAMLHMRARFLVARGGGTQHFGIRGRQSDIFGHPFFLIMIFLGQ